jgi:hypothetical protein
MVTKYLPVLFLLLSACGGGGGSSDSPSLDQDDSDNSNTDPDNTDTSNTWQGFSGEGEDETNQGIGLAIKRSGEEIYISYNTYTRRNLFSTQDGVTFHSYYTSRTSAFVCFVDELERIYLQGEYTDGEAFSQLEDGFPFGGFVNGDSSTLLVMDYAPKTGPLAGSTLKRSIDRGNTWTRIDLDNNPETTREASPSEPAFNGLQTFIVPSIESGLWVSHDSGITWNSTLSEEGRFDVVAGNKIFPNEFVAIKPGAVYTSSDMGSTWQESIPPSDSQGEIAEWIDLELLDDGQLVAWGVPINSENGIGQVFKSDNFGQSWTSVGNPIGQSMGAIGNLTVPNLEANSHFYFVNFNGNFYKLNR